MEAMRHCIGVIVLAIDGDGRETYLVRHIKDGSVELFPACAP